MNEIKFTELGFAIVSLYARQKDTPTMLSENFKVDTGANCTTISKAWLLQLGYDEEWIKTGRRLEGDARPTVASGLPLDDCYEVILPEIHIGGWVGYNWPVLTSLSLPFKFLLGTDSMQFFNWIFDYESNVCRFDLIAGKRKILFNQTEQSIHSINDIEKGDINSYNELQRHNKRGAQAQRTATDSAAVPDRKIFPVDVSRIYG